MDWLASVKYTYNEWIWDCNKYDLLCSHVNCVNWWIDLWLCFGFILGTVFNLAHFFVLASVVNSNFCIFILLHTLISICFVHWLDSFVFIYCNCNFIDQVPHPCRWWFFCQFCRDLVFPLHTWPFGSYALALAVDVAANFLAPCVNSS